MHVVVWVGSFSSFVALDGWRTVERVAPARPRAGQGRPRGLSHDGKLKVVESKGQAERHGSSSSFNFLSSLLPSLTPFTCILLLPSIHSLAASRHSIAAAPGEPLLPNWGLLIGRIRIPLYGRLQIHFPLFHHYHSRRLHSPRQPALLLHARNPHGILAVISPSTLPVHFTHDSSSNTL